MSSYKVVAEVSKTLRNVLWEVFKDDPVISDIVKSPEDIVFKNPTETARDSANRLSLWLYHITENEFVKNQPMIRGNDKHKTAQFPPLALNLFYLLTPFAPTGDPEAEHLVLGKIMQILYDNAIILLRDSSGGQEEEVAEELRIIFCRLTLEELTRVWEALQEPYRLSICYQVRVSRIDSKRTLGRERVVDRAADFA